MTSEQILILIKFPNDFGTIPFMETPPPLSLFIGNTFLLSFNTISTTPIFCLIIPTIQTILPFPKKMNMPQCSKCYIRKMHSLHCNSFVFCEVNMMKLYTEKWFGKLPHNENLSELYKELWCLIIAEVCHIFSGHWESRSIAFFSHLELSVTLLCIQTAIFDLWFFAFMCRLV